MAEERISIQVIDKDGDVRPFFVVSRTEVIDRMALGMFEYERPGCKGEVPIEDVWQDYKNHYTSLAEAAFDALITEVK